VSTDLQESLAKRFGKPTTAVRVAYEGSSEEIYGNARNIMLKSTYSVGYNAFADNTY